MPAGAILRRVWLQNYWWDGTQLHWREADNIPPAAPFISSPYNSEAHDAHKHTTRWVGYKVHLTETCEDDLPHLITNVETTSGPATGSDRRVSGGVCAPRWHRRLDQRLAAYLQTFEDESQGEVLERRPRPRRLSHNAPRFNVRQSLFQMTGVALMTIDGLHTGYLALDLLAELGRDRRPWPTEKPCCAWLCWCPGNKQTGGRLISSRTRRNASRAARIFRLAASALGAFHRRLKARLGPAKTLTATAHKLAQIVSYMLKHGKASGDRSVESYEQPSRARVIHNLKRRAQQMGFALVPVTVTPAAD